MSQAPFHAVPRETTGGDELPTCRCGRGRVRAPGQRNCLKCHAEAQRAYRRRNPRMSRKDLKALSDLCAKHLGR